MDTNATVVQGIITIAAVAVGALGTFLATQGVERDRWARERATRWDDLKLQAYTEYAASVKMAIIRSRSILGGLGLSPTLTPITREEGLPLLALEENSRSEKLEAVMMIGSPEVVAAARKWHEISWTFHHWASGTKPTTADEVEELYRHAQTAREAFYAATRRELGIPL
jgi:hypothetical protein